MSLLLPDYASSSEDEVSCSLSVPNSPSDPALHVKTSIPSLIAGPSTVPDAAKPKQKKTKKRKKIKTTLYLSPEIQRLLETGTGSGAFSDESESDNDHGLLSKHKRARKAASKRPRPSAVDKDSLLSFLPPPKHELPASAAVSTSVVATVESSEQANSLKTTETETGQQAVDEVAAAANAAAWQQYHLQQQQCQTSNTADSHDHHVAQGEEDLSGGSSKRKRARERDIERALQQGHFETVADQITDVVGPAPKAWQPPDNLADGRNGLSSQEVKVKASFWNAQAGTRVASIKPTRMQRQKHQLNQLAFDAKARDFELLEKRGAALKTKSETYAKYGW